MKITVSFSLDTKTDADLVRWLERQPGGKKSAAIRKAIRAGWGADGAGSVERKLDAILERLDRGIVVGAGSDGATAATEPPRASAALDRLGL